MRESGEIAVAKDERNRGERASPFALFGDRAALALSEAARLFERERNAPGDEEFRFLRHIKVAAEGEDEIRLHLSAERPEVRVARASVPFGQTFDYFRIRIADPGKLDVRGPRERAQDRGQDAKARHQ